ncbi:ankyrin, partial [Aureobasidium melanogenum CBS 110374]
LHIAVHSGHESIVDVLLNEGEDINEQNANGSPALNVAVLERRDANLQMLLEKEARLDIADVMGQTPAHSA